MNLPDSTNAEHQYAFKKGYRSALDGKTLLSMPSTIRYNPDMRQYFQQGWDQVQSEIQEGKNIQESPWRSRAAWWLMMGLAGIATASNMMSNMETSNADLESRTSAPNAIEIPTRSFTAQAEISPTPIEPLIASETEIIADNTAEPISTPEPSQAHVPVPKHTRPAAIKQSEETLTLSLLTPDQRKDLTLNKQEVSQNQYIEPTELETNDSTQFKVKEAVLSAQVSNRQAVNILSETVPKHIRKIYLFSNIQGANGKHIYHRWLYQDKEMATIKLNIKSDSYRTWSSKRMSSAWQGKWSVEILDENKKPVYRQTFTYVK